VPGPDSLRRHPAFVAFWIAEVASSFGFQMLAVAVGWQVYAITGRAFDLGLIGLVQFVPSLLLALPAGHAADQLDRRRIFVSGSSCRGSPSRRSPCSRCSTASTRWASSSSSA
jgi:MFS family permease